MILEVLEGENTGGSRREDTVSAGANFITRETPWNQGKRS